MGGWIPGYKAQPTEGRIFHEAKSNLIEDVVTYSKVPMLFDERTIVYLSQFPPWAWTQALSLLYDQLMFEAKHYKTLQEKGEDVQLPEYRDITLSMGRGQAKGETQTVTFKDVRTFAGSLLDDMERPINYKKVGKLRPHQRDKYDAGLIGYDLSDPWQAGEGDETERFGKAYIGMTYDTARNVLRKWRFGTASGFLGRIAKTNFEPVSFWGGQPAPFYMDWHGNVHKTFKVKDTMAGSKVSNDGIMMPVWNPDRLKTYYEPEMLSSDNTQKVWRYWVDGKEKEYKSHIPLLLPGYLVDAHSVQQYEKLMKAITPEVEKDDKAKLQEAKDQFKELILNADRFDMWDYLVRSMNPELKKLGLRRIFGGVHTLTNLKGQVQGTHEDYETTQRHFLAHGFSDNMMPTTLSHKDEVQAKSAVTDGINRFLGKLYARVGNTTEFVMMRQIYDDLVQEAIIHIRGKVGEPVFTQFAEAKRNPKTTPAKLKKLYDRLWRYITIESDNFAQTVWQLDWGRGPRRRRMNINAVGLHELVKSSSIEELLTDIQSGQGFKGHLTQKEERGLVQAKIEDIAKRTPTGSQTRRSFRAATGGIESPVRQVPVATGASSIIFGTHLKTMLANTMHEIEEAATTIRGEQQKRGHETREIRIMDMAGEVKEGQSRKFMTRYQASLRLDVYMRTKIFDKFVILYVQDQLSKGIKEENINMKKAYEWADQQTRQTLKSRGIHVSDPKIPGLEKAKVSDKANDRMDEEKKAIASAIKTAEAGQLNPQQVQAEEQASKVADNMLRNSIERVARGVETPDERHERESSESEAMMWEKSGEHARLEHLDKIPIMQLPVFLRAINDPIATRSFYDYIQQWLPSRLAKHPDQIDDAMAIRQLIPGDFVDHAITAAKSMVAKQKKQPEPEEDDLSQYGTFDL